MPRILRGLSLPQGDSQLAELVEGIISRAWSNNLASDTTNAWVCHRGMMSYDSHRILGKVIDDMPADQKHEVIKKTNFNNVELYPKLEAWFSCAASFLVGVQVPKGEQGGDSALCDDADRE